MMMRPRVGFDKMQVARFGLNLALWLGIFIIVLFLQLHRGTSLIVDMNISSGGLARLFYDRGEGYAEHDSVARSVRPGNNHLIFPLWAGTYQALRFDPVNNDSEVVISGMSISGAAPESGPIRLGSLIPLANIGKFERRAYSVNAAAAAGSKDPQLQVRFDGPLQVPSGSATGESAGVAAIFATALLLLIALVQRATKSAGLVVAGMGVVLGLILAMALLSNTHIPVHPDEDDHFRALSYFTHHWLPPAVDDLEVGPSISIYGVSYLAELDVVYLLAEKVTAPLTDVVSSPSISARLFNVGLWLTLMLIAAGDRRTAIAFTVLLFSPQIWYVFSYFNGDALPLLLGLIAAAFLIQSGGLSSFIKGEGKFGFAAVSFAVCMGLLLLSKRNYLILVPGLILWTAIQFLALRWRELVGSVLGLLLLIFAEFAGDMPDFSGRHGNVFFLVLSVIALSFSFWSVCQRAAADRAVRMALLRISALVAIAVIVAVPRVVWDVHVNGLPAEKSKRIEAVAETYAGPEFKPSALQNHQGHPKLWLASQGVGFSQLLFQPYHWIAICGASAFGVYGYMSVYTPLALYILLQAISVLAMGLLVRTLARNSSGSDRQAAVLGLCFCGLVILSSMLHSWLHDFQPQGRYLFPCVPMVALMTDAARRNLPLAAVRWLVLAAFTVGVYSFAMFALPAFANSQ